MGGRGAKSSSKVSGGHGKAITAEEFVQMTPRERVHTSIALKKKIKAGTATKQEKKSYENLQDAHAMRSGFKNLKDQEKRLPGILAKREEERRKAIDAWARVNSTTWTRYRNRQTAKFQRWYWGSAEK